MIHFLMTISNEKELWHRVESFICTMPKKKYYLSLVLTGIGNKSDSIIYRDEELENKIKNEKFFLKPFDLFFSNEHYKTHPPVRWHIENKCDTCVFIDCDMFLCSDLNEFETPIDYLGGVIAYDSPLTLIEWKELFSYLKIKFPIKTYITHNTKKECPFYISFGFVLTNDKIKKAIAQNFYKNLQKIQKIKKYNKLYFLAQVALTITIYELEINFKELPLRYNFPDYKHFENMYIEEFKNVKVFHSLNKKPDFFSIDDLENYKKSITLNQNKKLSSVFKKIISNKFKYIL